MMRTKESGLNENPLSNGISNSFSAKRLIGSTVEVVSPVQRSTWLAISRMTITSFADSKSLLFDFAATNETIVKSKQPITKKGVNLDFIKQK
jgi:hypothetical protein